MKKKTLKNQRPKPIKFRKLTPFDKKYNRCIFCGKFMSDDDILLGCQTDYIDGPRYAHSTCTITRGYEIQ